MAFRELRGLIPTLKGPSTRRVRKDPLIAVVDDDKSMRDTIKDLLESEGFVAVTFSSASNFLKCRRLTTIGCLIADMRMPGMSGLELSQHLAATRRPIPTILISAFPNEQMRAQAASARVVCYLVKPFSAEELLTCVKDTLQRRIGR
jgi:FixJ family two-component response regulator